MSADKIIRVSVSEASRLFGVSGLTIRRAIKTKEINYVVVHNRYKIAFESLIKWSQKTATTRNKLAGRGIGQFVEMWKIRNTLYSPNPALFEKKPAADSHVPKAPKNKNGLA